IGLGRFGFVYAARLNKSQRLVAVKQVLHDPLDREVDILNRLKDHCNIVQLHMNIHVYLGQHYQKYSLLAMDHMPMSLMDYIAEQQQRFMPLTYVRIIAYQLFRALAFMHSHGICHRDIRPENLLIDPLTMNLRVNDFGSAIFLEQPQISPSISNQSDSASDDTMRLYRAPELFGSCAVYSTSADIWSAGCVLAEIINGRPLFEPCGSDREQLLHFILVLGTFGLERAPHLMDASGVAKVIVETHANWELLLNTDVTLDLLELLNNCLVYDAGARISPLAACAHASFDELRL
ncbi:hypothetical protein KR044_001022, partial [Drosophila immigrans]